MLLCCYVSIWFFFCIWCVLCIVYCNWYQLYLKVPNQFFFDCSIFSTSCWIHWYIFISAMYDCTIVRLYGWSKTDNFSFGNSQLWWHFYGIGGAFVFGGWWNLYYVLTTDIWKRLKRSWTEIEVGEKIHDALTIVNLNQ